MPSPSAIAANLSGLLYLTRQGSATGDELGEAARVFLEAMAGAPVTIDIAVNRLTINGTRVPAAAPGSTEVTEQLLVHNVSRLSLPATADAEAVLALARTLSAPGMYRSWDEMIATLGPDQAGATLIQASSDLTFVHFDDQVGLDTSGKALQMLGETAPEMTDLTLAQVEDVPNLAPRIEPERPPAPMEDPVILARLVAARGQQSADSPDASALLQVAGDFLTAADRAVNEAVARIYLRELRRLTTRRHMTAFAKCAAMGEHRDLATEVLRSLGPEATEVLMELLVETESLAERRGYYSALTRMQEGVDVIIHYLRHPKWYVVRNAADLCGELGLAGAVPELAKQVGHPDERARKSIAVALNRIGTREALEPLARMLKDGSPAIRAQVLGNLDGGRARPLAMPLAALLETEEHPEVLREILKALGRIGTPDALLALRRVGQGEVRRLGRRGRLLAIEALGGSGGPAVALLRSFASGPDREIAAAATRALESAVV